jgi:hypothetical protein
VCGAVRVPAALTAASSSTSDGNTMGSIPAERRVASLAGEVDAR